MKTVKTVVALFLGASLSTAAFATSPKMPKQFLGVWGETAKICKIPKDSPIDFPDTGAKIRSQGIERYENYCELKAISKSKANSTTGIFLCSVEGEKFKDTLTLSLSSTGKLLGLNEKALVHCK